MVNVPAMEVSLRIENEMHSVISRSHCKAATTCRFCGGTVVVLLDSSYFNSRMAFSNLLGFKSKLSICPVVLRGH